MIETATGLVFRTRPLTETSLIVHWLTPHLGRLATVAKGARRVKSPSTASWTCSTSLDFSFSRSPRSELHTLREVILRETHSRPSPGPPPAPASLLLRRLDRACHRDRDAPAPRLRPDDRPAATPPGPAAAAANRLCLRAQAAGRARPGAGPRRKASLNPGTRQLVNALTDERLAGDGTAEAQPAQLSELRQFLHGFLEYHLGRVLKGRASARYGLGVRVERAPAVEHLVRVAVCQQSRRRLPR